MFVEMKTSSIFRCQTYEAQFLAEILYSKSKFNWQNGTELPFYFLFHNRFSNCPGKARIFGRHTGFYRHGAGHFRYG
jgi:hypothetical protein